MDKIYYTCPFCGSHKIRLNAAYTGGKNDCWCECGDCHAQGPHVSTKEGALVYWNRYEERNVDLISGEGRKMKLIYADGGVCFINAACIVGAQVKYNRALKIENGKAVPYEGYDIVVHTKDGGEYIITKDMTEAEAKAKLKKIGNYLTTDASFLIDFNEE